MGCSTSVMLLASSTYDDVDVDVSVRMGFDSTMHGVVGRTRFRHVMNVRTSFEMEGRMGVASGVGVDVAVAVMVSPLVDDMMDSIDGVGSADVVDVDAGVDVVCTWGGSVGREMLTA